MSSVSEMFWTEAPLQAARGRSTFSLREGRMPKLWQIFSKTKDVLKNILDIVMLKSEASVD